VIKIEKDRNPLEEVIAVMQQVELFNYIVKKEKLPFKITGIRLPDTTLNLMQQIRKDIHHFEFGIGMTAHRINDEEMPGFIIEITKNQELK